MDWAPIRTLTPHDLAEAIDVPTGELWRFARIIEREFKPSRVQRVKGKERVIDAPRKRAMKILKRIHRVLQRVGVSHPAAYGGVSGRSCFDHAVEHLGKRYVFTRDGKDCFPTVTRDAFRRELRELGVRHDTATLLTNLCIVRNRIPQGSPLSGDALNLFFWRLDERIHSSANGATYGRVYDDLVVSTDDETRGEELAGEIEAGFHSRGISVNAKKRRESGRQDRSQPQLVHNIRVDDRRGTGVSSAHREKSLRLAADYVIACERLTADAIASAARKRHSLQGMLNYCSQARFGPVKHLRQHLARGDRLVARTLRGLSIAPKGGKWWVKTRSRNVPKEVAAIWRRRIASAS